MVSAAANDDDTTGIAISLQGTTGGTALSATLSGKGKAEAIADATLTASLSARNPDATSLLALAGLPALPLGLVGEGEITLSLDGVPSRSLDTAFDLTGDRFLAHFDGTTALGADGPSAKGKVRLEADDIEPWMMTTGAIFPGMGTGLPVALNADADFGAGLLVLGEIAGTIGENAVAGDINADVRQGTPNLTGAVTRRRPRPGTARRHASRRWRDRRRWKRLGSRPVQAAGDRCLSPPNSTYQPTRCRPARWSTPMIRR